MAVEFAYDPEKQIEILYCNTEDRAFGPLFQVGEAESFMAWLKDSEVPWAVGSHISGSGHDPRDYPPADLEEIVKHWRQLVEDGEL
jgi:hypothetical protein